MISELRNLNDFLPFLTDLSGKSIPHPVYCGLVLPAAQEDAANEMKAICFRMISNLGGKGLVAAWIGILSL